LILDFFEQERAAGRPLVAAIVVATVGSTYRKPGALMLFAADGRRSGLLSGGCLENDLGQRAQALLASTRRVELADYDSRSSDDPIWGLGLGCEGLMQILLLRVDAKTGYEPLSLLARLDAAGAAGAYAISLSEQHPSVRAGTVWPDDRGQPAGLATTTIDERPLGLFVAAVERAPAVLLCGAGPDAEPVVAWGAALGWHVTVVDHRPAYVDAARFPAARLLRRIDADALGSEVELARFDAAVVMSHHLVADGRYLRELARSPVPYVGLLGPAARRERLFAELGPEPSAALRARLRAPVGLDLGGRAPEAIALSIVAEIQAVLHGRRGEPFSAHQGTMLPS
jgi:xanthine/CO dehydrogenase XdhC/CoxF family maturation factor